MLKLKGCVDGIGAYDFKGDADVFAVTLTGNYSVGNLMIKPELRLDSASEDATFMDNDLNPFKQFIIICISGGVFVLTNTNNI